MRIHFNLSPVAAQEAIQRATRAAGVWRERNERHGSRSHQCAYDVILSGDSPHRVNGNPDAYAASWDQWGIFLAVIYAVDPTAKSWAYKSAEDFNEKTGHRFDPAYQTHVDSTSHPQYQRTTHNWQVVPDGFTWRCINAKHGDCAAVLGR